MRQINSSECNHSGHSDGGGSRSGKAEGGVDAIVVVVIFVVVVFFRINTEWIVRIAGLLIVVILLTVFVTLFTLFVRLLVVFTILIVSLTLSIVVRLLFFFGAVVDISGAFGFISEDIVSEIGNLIGVVVLVDGDVGNLVSRLDSSIVTSVGICISKHS